MKSMIFIILDARKNNHSAMKIFGDYAKRQVRSKIADLPRICYFQLISINLTRVSRLVRPVVSRGRYRQPISGKGIILLCAKCN